MRHTVCTLILMYAVVASAHSQADVESVLSTRFKNADSVIIVVHDNVQGSTDVIVDSKGHTVEFPSLMLGNRPNPAILLQKKVLNKKESYQLASIFLKEKASTVLSQGGCFIPHHAIFFFRGERISYVDLCFYCMSARTSEDLGGFLYLEKGQWKRLEDYFDRLGLKYEHGK